MNSLSYTCTIKIYCVRLLHNIFLQYFCCISATVHVYSRLSVYTQGAPTSRVHVVGHDRHHFQVSQEAGRDMIFLGIRAMLSGET